MKRQNRWAFACAAALIHGCSSSPAATNSGTPTVSPATGVPQVPTSAAAAGAAGAGTATNVMAPNAAQQQPPGPGSSATPAMTTMPAGNMTNQTPPGNTTTPVDPKTVGAPVAEPCGITTQWAGDEFCIKPPAVDKGFQVHIGPTNYDNPESQYVLAAGAEVTENFSAVSGNDKDIYYYVRQYRMRPGSHHLIVYANSGGFMPKRLGGTQNHIKDNPENGVIAPENADVGMPLSAKTPLSISLHYINLTDKPILKEAWINFLYRDPSVVKEPALEIFSSTPMMVQPGQHVILSGSCPITQAGHVITLYGHRHANNLRFSAYRTRGAKRDLVFDDYDWVEPAILEFSSLVTNPAPNPAGHTAGGWSGILDLMPGDSIDFECEIKNDTSNTFVGLNEAKNDEMCILVGDSVGALVPGRCTTSTQNL